MRIGPFYFGKILLFIKKNLKKEKLGTLRDKLDKFNKISSCILLSRKWKKIFLILWKCYYCSKIVSNQTVPVVCNPITIWNLHQTSHQEGMQVRRQKKDNLIATAWILVICMQSASFYPCFKDVTEKICCLTHSIW